MTEVAIAYGRKSFDDPENRTSSVADQEMFARDYAKRNDLDVVQFFGDNGITGATMERPALQNALAWLKAGKAKVLIIEDVDRLGRDQEHLAYMRKLFVAYDVTLHTVHSHSKVLWENISAHALPTRQDVACAARRREAARPAVRP